MELLFIRIYLLLECSNYYLFITVSVIVIVNPVLCAFSLFKDLMLSFIKAPWQWQMGIKRNLSSEDYEFESPVEEYYVIKL